MLCQICKCPLDSNIPFSGNCGGDCCLCMAEAGDPDAVTSVLAVLRERRRVSLDKLVQREERERRALATRWSHQSRIIEMRKGGQTWDQIGKTMGFSGAMASKYVRDIAPELFPPRPTEEERKARIAEIVRLRAAGTTYREIGKRFNISPSRVAWLFETEERRKRDRERFPTE